MPKAIRHYVPLISWMLVLLVLFLIPLEIIGYDHVPGGDARRAVAKSTIQKSFSQIVVLRPDYTMDNSPG